MKTVYSGTSPSDIDMPTAIAASGNMLAWVDSKQNLVVGSADGSVSRSNQQTGGAAGVVVADASGFVWSVSSGAGLLSASLLPTASPTTMSAPSGANPTLVVLDSTYAYWFNSTDSSLYRSARTGSSSYTVLASPVSAVQLAVDGANVYWASTPTGTINAVPKNATGATTPTVLAKGQTGVVGIAVDPGATGAIYWTVGYRIFALAK
jgi:hypothetical protein